MARGAALAAALVVSLLAVSGAGGSGAQTPSVAGRSSSEGRRRARLPQPTASRALRDRRPPCSSIGERFSRPRSTSAPTHVAAASSSPASRSRGSRRSRSRTTFAPRRGGATACRSRRATSSSRTAPDARKADADRRGAHTGPRCAASRAARREDGPGCAARAIRRLATALFGERPAAPRPRRARSSRASGADGIDNPKTGAPIGSGPFLVRALGARQAADAGPESPLLGAAPRLSRPARLPLPRSGHGAPRNAFRRGELDIRLGLSRCGSVADAPAGAGVSVSSATLSSAGSTSSSGSAPAATRRSRNKLVRQALAYGIDRAAIVRQVLGRRAERLRCATAPSS